MKKINKYLYPTEMALNYQQWKSGKINLFEYAQKCNCSVEHLDELLKKFETPGFRYTPLGAIDSIDATDSNFSTPKKPLATVSALCNHIQDSQKILVIDSFNNFVADFATKIDFISNAYSSNTEWNNYCKDLINAQVQSCYFAQNPNWSPGFDNCKLIFVIQLFPDFNNAELAFNINMLYNIITV